MPGAPLPPELGEFLSKPRPAVIATIRSGGSPVTAACWYEWAAGNVLLTMDADSRRIQNIRRDPRVALTVLGDNWYTHISLLGRAVEIRDDLDFVDADRLSMLCLGEPYDRRDYPGNYLRTMRPPVRPNGVQLWAGRGNRKVGVDNLFPGKEHF